MMEWILRRLNREEVIFLIDKPLVFSKFNKSFFIGYSNKDFCIKPSCPKQIYLLILCFLTSDMSLDLDDSLNNNSITAAGGKPTEYLGMAKKGGGHQGNSCLL